MSGDIAEFNGEFNHTLKGFKIPLKANLLVNACDTPAPPGTEDLTSDRANVNANANESTYVSPLADVFEPRQPKFVNLPCSQPQLLFPLTTIVPIPTIDNVINPGEKTSSSSLFTKPSPDGLPDELTKLFRPFRCDLCSNKLNSPQSARLHYESKNHAKKVNAWLLLKTGEPAPKRKNVDKGPTGPNALHCDVCDLPLTSIQHAKQHYMGRKHNNVLAGRGKPGGSGYYDKNNKWVRTAQIPEEEPNNRFSIGESFLKQNQSQNESTDANKPSLSEIIEVPDSVLNLSPPPPPLDCVDAPPGNDLYLSPSDLIPQVPIVPAIPIIPKESISELSKYCKICDINVTSEMHMRLHLNGAKHAKKLRHLGEAPYTNASDTLAQCIINEPTITTGKRKHSAIAAKTAPSTTTNELAASSDFSVFRTPSGQYYCHICDLSVTSEVTLSQHFASKRHIRAVSQSKRK